MAKPTPTRASPTIKPAVTGMPVFSAYECPNLWSLTTLMHSADAVSEHDVEWQVETQADSDTQARLEKAQQGAQAGSRQVFLSRNISAHDAVDHAGQSLALGSGQLVAAQHVGFVEYENQQDHHDWPEPGANKLAQLLFTGRRPHQVSGLEIQHQVSGLRHRHAGRGADHDG